MSAKIKMKLICTTAPIEKVFKVKYLEKSDCDRYNAGIKGDQIGNGQWAFD